MIESAHAGAVAHEDHHSTNAIYVIIHIVGDYSRRKFLGIAATAAAGLYGLHKKEKIKDALGGADSIFEKDRLLKECADYLNHEYGITLSRTGSWMPLVTAHSLKEIPLLKKALAQAILPALAKYNPVAIKNRRAHLSLVGAIYVGSESPAGIETISGALFLNAYAIFDNGWGENGGEIMFDHELYHQFDRAERGSLIYRRHWDKLHEEECVCSPYLDAKKWEFSSQIDLLFEIFFGTDYGRMNEAEDRAVIASFMLNPERHEKLLAILSKAGDIYETFKNNAYAHWKTIREKRNEGTAMPEFERELEVAIRINKRKYDDIRANYAKWELLRSDYAFGQKVSQESYPPRIKELIKKLSE